MIFLSLGSNLSSDEGDRFKNIDLAISYLLKHKIELIKKSSFYETPSYPDISNPRFINIVTSVQTHLKPEELAAVIIETEKKLGRVRKKKNDPRTCDIDIIDFNNKVMNFSYNKLIFKVPHEKLSERNFVLYPLKEISPNWLHPINNVKIDILIQNLPDNLRNSILKVKKN